ncbi:MAG: hypothetical protein M1827_000870 [Pycnora praestabilis]|nr:MAG: hypothetical protein M1827_000870 [Pycnora praestabilis]
MGSLADHSGNVLANDNIHDFILYPAQESYSDMLDHSRQEEGFSNHQYSLDEQYSNMATTTYDSYECMSAYSAPRSFIEAPQFYIEAPQDNATHEQYRYTSSESPTTSASHSFDHQPPTLSSSGASVPSAASSTIGSPYSGATSHIVPSSGSWIDPTNQDLLSGPSIVHNDSFCDELLVSAALEHEMIFAHDNKMPSGFVGECARVSSSTTPNVSVSSSSSVSQSLSTFPPSLVLNTTMAGSAATIDTILYEVNNEIRTPRSSSSPASAISPSASRYNPSRHQANSPAPVGMFKSPTTPASARANSSPRAFSPAMGHKGGLRRRSVANGGVHKREHTPPVSPKPIYIPGPNPSAFQGPNGSCLHQSPFFTQSSGNFVAPLQSSCWSPFAQSFHDNIPKGHSFRRSLAFRICQQPEDRSSFTDLSSLVDPSLIQPFPINNTSNFIAPPYSGEIPGFNTSQAPVFQPPSPAPSNSSNRGQLRAGSAKFKSGSQSPYLHTTPFQPYPQRSTSRRPSVSSDQSRAFSQGSPGSASTDFDDETKEKGKCQFSECGKIFKDLKAHMLTHLSERPEKCPIVTCDYHTKGFARKYDKNRHTLTHYKGTMVCGFCPGSGSNVEKSFNRADVFKRHLTSVHGVEQTPPNSRKKVSPTSNKKFTTYAHDATGKCSTCSFTFNNAQDFYEHLDDCVLRVVQQEEPSEANNERHLTSVEDDEAVQATMDRHSFPTKTEYPLHNHQLFDEDDEDDYENGKEDDNDDTWTGRAASNRARSSLSGKGVVPHLGGGNAINKSTRQMPVTKGRGLTYSKGGVPLVSKGRKKRKHYPLSWGCPTDKMKMKKRVLCVYDGQRRLWKDDMMLDNEFEVRLQLGDGKSYVTDLDVETLKRAEAFHNASEEERGPWIPDDMQDVDIRTLMA